MTSVSEATHRLLLDHGVDRIFGNPGSTEMRFFRNLPPGLDYVMVPQEAAALAMADGYAQASGTVGVVMVHSAAGLGNALGSLFTADCNGAPQLVIAGQQTRSLLPHDPYLYARQPTEFPQPYVKFAAEASRAEDVPEVIAQALRYAVQPPAGPVFVSVPEDDWDAPASPVRTRRVSTSLGVTPDDAARIRRALEDASSPALVLGTGVAGSRRTVVKLAEQLDARVLVAPLASRSPFPEDHPLFAGFLPPVAEQVRHQLAGHDVVLVLGAPVFTYHVASDGLPIEPGTALVQVVDDPRQAALACAGDSILASPDALIDALLREAATTSSKSPSGTPDDTARAGQDDLPAQPRATSLSPEEVMRALDLALPDDAVIVEEAPTHRNAMHAHLPIKADRDFFVAASGGLGWGAPAAVGVALARPDKRVVCVIGDGSSLYSPQALWTAAQRGADVTFVVLNNGGYAAMKAFGDRLGVPDAPGLDLPGVDFSQLAGAFGVRSTRVLTAEQLVPALEERHPGPHLIDIATGPAASALY